MAAVTSTHHGRGAGGRPGGAGNGFGREVPSIPLSPDQPPALGDQSIGDLVKDATTHLSTLIRSEVELAKSEVVGEVRKGLQGSVYFIAALSIAMFSLFFLFFSIAELLDLVVPRPLAFTIVFLMMVLAAALLVQLGARRMRSIQKPERTISSVRDTAAIIRRPDQSDDDDYDQVGPAGFGPRA